MISGFANYVGGLENVVNELEDFLVKRDIIVTVFAEKKPFFLPKKLQNIYFSRSSYHKLYYSLESQRKLHRYDFDIIHGHGENCFFVALLRRNTPFVMTFHGTYSKSTRQDARILPSYYAEKTAAYKCDIAVACSNSVKEEIKSQYGISGNKIKVIYNGVDTETFAPQNKDQSRQILNLPKSKYYALWVGRDPFRKGLKTVLKTLADFPDVHLIIVGFRMANTKKVTCFGKASLDKLVNAYNSADFLFFPTIYEGFPNVPMEAMACGLPIIVSKQSNMGEVISQGKQGFVVDNDNYSDRIESLLQNQQLREKIAVNCRELALHYDWNKQAQKYLDLYKKLSN